MKETTSGPDLRADDVLEQLLKAASPRPAPSPQDTAMVHQAVHAEWRRVTGKRAFRRRIISYALAATVLVTVFAAFNTFRIPAPDVVQVATIEKSFGSIYLLAESSELRESGNLGNLQSGQTIVTGSEAGMALTWSKGGSLRVDENTRVEFTAPDSVYLQAGRIYFDSRAAVVDAPATVADALEIRSEHGVVAHVGTQFMTAVEPDMLVVSVREGEVAIDGVFHELKAVSGQQVTLAGRQRPSVLNINRNSTDWDWVVRTSPPVDVDGRSLHEFLQWACREMGLELRYEGEAERVARYDAILKGSIDTVPSEALRLRLASAALAWRIDDGGVIYVSDHP